MSSSLGTDRLSLPRCQGKRGSLPYSGPFTTAPTLAYHFRTLTQHETGKNFAPLLPSSPVPRRMSFMAMWMATSDTKRPGEFQFGHPAMGCLHNQARTLLMIGTAISPSLSFPASTIRLQEF